MQDWELYVFLLLTFPLLQSLETALHEHGHALSALVFTSSSSVEIYLGSYGDTTAAYQFKVGRLQYYWHPFRLSQWGKGLTKYTHYPGWFPANYIILLSGVLGSLLVSGFLLWAALHLSTPSWLKLLALVLFAQSCAALLFNLYPSSGPLPADDSPGTYNDGRQLLQLWQSSAVARVAQRAATLMMANRNQLALRLLHSITFESHTPQTLRLLLQCGAQSGLPGPYTKGFQCLQARDTLHSNDWVLQGILLGRQGNYSEALGCFDQALHLPFSDVINIESNRAFVYLEAGMHSHARASFSELARREPTAYNLAHKGLLATYGGKPAEGWALIETALQQAPDCAYSKRAAGLCQLWLQNPAQALQYFAAISEAEERIPRLETLIRQARQLIISQKTDKC